MKPHQVRQHQRGPRLEARQAKHRASLALAGLSPAAPVFAPSWGFGLAPVAPGVWQPALLD
eukprot:9235285-Pyramimonas_sp.AAC.1